MDKQEILEKWNKVPELLRDIIEALVAVVIIIIILKVVLGSKLLMPIVVVISGSMLHEPGDDSWNTWLTGHGVTGQQISNFPLQDGFARGDMIVTMRPDVKLGDVVVYNRDPAHNSQRSEPIIHRVVGVVTIEDSNVAVEGTTDCWSKDKILGYAQSNSGYSGKGNPDKLVFYITKGDHNAVSDQCGNIAFPVSEEQLLAKTFIKIPKIGYLKLCMFDPLHCLDSQEK
jgi:hypothetical protein